MLCAKAPGLPRVETSDSSGNIWADRLQSPRHDDLQRAARSRRKQPAPAIPAQEAPPPTEAQRPRSRNFQQPRQEQPPPPHQRPASLVSVVLAGKCWRGRAACGLLPAPRDDLKSALRAESDGQHRQFAEIALRPATPCPRQRTKRRPAISPTRRQEAAQVARFHIIACRAIPKQARDQPRHQITTRATFEAFRGHG